MTKKMQTKERPQDELRELPETNGSEVEAALADEASTMPAVIERDEALGRAVERVRQTSEETLLAQLQNMERGVEVIRRRAEALSTIRTMALRLTAPADWIQAVGQDGVATATLKASGAQKIAPLYGVSLRNVRPLGDRGEFAPERIELPDGAFDYRAWCDVYVGLTGAAIDALEFTRRSTEDFVGRKTDRDGRIVKKHGVNALDGDIRNAVFSGLMTRAVRFAAGMTRVPVEDIAAAWDGTSKKVERIPSGFGGGSSSERAAAAATAPEEAGDIDDRRKKLGAELMRRTGGDKEAAQKLLVEITSQEASGKRKAFAGFDSLAKLTQDWQFDNATKKLAEHPVFGDRR